MLNRYITDSAAVLEDFIAKTQARRGGLLVVGMSSSEVAGGTIGRASAPEIGETVIDAMIEECAARGIDLAVQCCEHLNRALVMEGAVARTRGYRVVFAVPHPHAGGSAAAAAYARFAQPVLVERVEADYGIDIGVTMIGMHMRPVAVPVRTDCRIGNARVDFAYARSPLIGGERARYE